MVKTLLSIVIPCYNEAEGIDSLHSRLIPVLSLLKKDYDLELIFIDDGSTDNTNKLLCYYFGKLSYVKIIKHEKNMNLGAAFKTGFSAANGGLIVTLDSDCTYDPEEIPKLLKIMKENDYDVVTGSPYHPLGKVENVPRYRIFLSKSVSLLYKIATGRNINTFTSMFRAYKKEVVKNVNFKSNDFLSPAEILIIAMNKGYKVGEMPSVLHVRKFGHSKFNKLFRIIRKHLNLVINSFLLRMKVKSAL